LVLKKYGGLGLGLGLETQSLGLGLGLDKKVLFTSLVIIRNHKCQQYLAPHLTNGHSKLPRRQQVLEPPPQTQTDIASARKTSPTSMSQARFTYRTT